MKSLTQLIQEKLESDGRVLYEIWKQGKEMNYNEILDWHTSSLTAIIRNEIERKKGMQKYFFEGGQTEKALKVGYNTAITEDIAYWENVLKEIEKNV